MYKYWEVDTLPDGDFIVCSHEDNPEPNVQFEDCLVADIPKITKNAEYNAHLICSAVNACIKINPDNPQAAAAVIEDAFDVLEHVNNMPSHSPSDYQVIKLANNLLIRTKGK
jgi:hypothetical protein